MLNISRKLILGSLSIGLILGLSACDSAQVDPSGAVSQDLAKDMDAYLGTYSGKLVKRVGHTGRVVNADFRLEFSRVDNRPVLKSDSDLIGEGCGSSIGKLLTLQTGGLWDALATFEFNPGQCEKNVRGRKLVVRANSNGDAQISLFVKDNGWHGSHRRVTELRADLQKAD